MALADGKHEFSQQLDPRVCLSIPVITISVFEGVSILRPSGTA